MMMSAIKTLLKVVVIAPDFHCFRADEDNMVVKEIDDETIC